MMNTLPCEGLAYKLTDRPCPHFKGLRHMGNCSTCCREVLLEAVAAERERCAKIAEAEPNLPGPMPEHVREQVDKALANGKLEEICRHFAGSMQKSIVQKIREG